MKAWMRLRKGLNNAAMTRVDASYRARDRRCKRVGERGSEPGEGDLAPSGPGRVRTTSTRARQQCRGSSSRLLDPVSLFLLSQHYSTDDRLPDVTTKEGFDGLAMVIMVMISPSFRRVRSASVPTYCSVQASPNRYDRRYEQGLPRILLANFRTLPHRGYSYATG